MVKKQKTNFEIVAYILGIVSIVNAVFSPLLGIVFGIIGLVLSDKQKSVLSHRAKILNIIGIVVGIILFVLVLIVSIKNPQLSTNFLG